VSRQRPGWLGVALASSLGGLAGVLATLALGGGATNRVVTITVPAEPPEDTRLVARTAVPDVIGDPLGTARRRLRGDGFLVEVVGAGLLDRLFRRPLTVTRQDPRAGAVLEVGATVYLRVRRR
jgi:hypothetical protein